MQEEIASFIKQYEQVYSIRSGDDDGMRELQHTFDLYPSDLQAHIIKVLTERGGTEQIAFIKKKIW